MIIDTLAYGPKYFGLGERFAKAIAWLQSEATHISEMENGRYDIEGDMVYAIVNSYDTKVESECGWEAHQRYADIHYSVVGSERIGYAPISQMNESKGYDEEKDYSLYTGTGDWVRVDEGMICILLPQDVHAPGRMVEVQSTYLKKVVIKVLL